MSKDLKMQLIRMIKIMIALTPWLVSMYLLFWLGKHEVWIPETPHRDKITIAILVVGMASSFFVYSIFFKHKRR